MQACKCSCRYPIQVNVEAGNLHAEIDRALNTVICNLGTKGPSLYVYSAV
jgi:hypothetical protein